jgi:putative FmdB family regulatory protein
LSDTFSWNFVVPIYAYKCSACGHAQDVLQKISDPQLTVCPECSQETYSKQVTAAGFQLKGSGWYVTDFKNGASGSSSSSTGTSTGGSTPSTPPASSPASS